MNKTELVSLMGALQIRPDKRLGQNFLVDDNLLDWIVREVDPRPGQLILEVGPGFGCLTEKLIGAGAQVISVEYDRKLHARLAEKLRQPNFRLIHKDICRCDLDELTGGADFRCAANLPYNISSVFAAELLEMRNPPLDAHFMLQKEMAQRMSADMSTDAYGALSVRLQAFYEIKILRAVNPMVFFPAPDVDSAFVQLKRREDLPSAEERKFFCRLARVAFCARRKKLVNNLASAFDKAASLAAVEAVGIDPHARPEKISPQTYLLLARELAERTS